MRGRATEYCDLIGPFNLGCQHKLLYTIVPDSIPVEWRVESGAETKVHPDSITSLRFVTIGTAIIM